MNPSSNELVITLGDVATFQGKVTRGTPEQCWPYDGVSVSLGDRRRAPQWVAASVARNRPLGPEEKVRAKCMTPHCCNPAHLRVLHKSDAPYIELRPVASKLPARAEDATCSYCGCQGGGGTALVCGRPTTCPACSVPGWAELVARFGAESA